MRSGQRLGPEPSYVEVVLRSLRGLRFHPCIHGFLTAPLRF